MALYGAKSLGAAKDVGRFLFSHHPTPMWSRANHDLVDSGRDWGALGNALDWAERKISKSDAIIHPTNTGPHTPVYRHPTMGWTSQESGYGPSVLDLKGRIVDAARSGNVRQALSHVGEGLSNTGRSLGHGVGEILRDQVFGSPIDLHRQLTEHGNPLRSAGQHLKEFYLPSGSGVGHKLQLAASLGMPAYGLYQGLQYGGPENRGKVIGSTIASTLASPFTARLGIPGMAVQGLASNLGGRLGGLFDPKTPDAPELQVHTPLLGRGSNRRIAPTYSFDQPPETSASTATPGAP
jgi:hypothetical protein